MTPSFGRMTAALLTGLLLALPGCLRARPAPPSPPAPAPRIVISSSKPKAAPASSKAGDPSLLLIEGANAAEVGLDFYPGATVAKSEVTRKQAETTAGAELVTRDSYQQVVDFYRLRYASPELKVTVRDLPSGKLTLLNWRDPQGNYTVGLRRDNERKHTVITLARIVAQPNDPKP